MAIFQVQSKDTVVKLNWYTALNSIQNFEWTPAFNEEYYKELGNEGYAAYSIQPDLTGSFDMTATGSTVAFLRRMIQDFSAGEFNGYKAGAPDSTTHNDATITGADLEFAVFDVIEAKKPHEVFSRSTILPRCMLSSLSMRADSNGTASETYSFEGELADVFRSPYHDLVSIPLTRQGASTTVLAVPDVPGTGNPYAVDVSGGPSIADAEWIIAYLMVEEVRIDGTVANIVAQYTSNVFDGTITLQSPHTAALGQRVHAIIYKKTAGSFPTMGTPPANARFVRADDISIWLVKKSDIDLYAQADLNAGAVTTALTDARLFLRVQSADINIDLRREALRQIKKSKNGSIYYRAATYPLNITASATTLESDLADWSRMQGKDFGGAEVSTTIDLTKLLNLLDFESQEWQLVMRYYKSDTLLQTTALCDAKITNRSTRVAVDGRAEVTWNFTGSLIKISGDTAP